MVIQMVNISAHFLSRHRFISLSFACHYMRLSSVLSFKNELSKYFMDMMTASTISLIKDIEKFSSVWLMLLLCSDVR